MASQHHDDGSLASAEQTGDPSLAAAAHTHLAWVLAHVGDVAARPRAELAWEYFSVYEKNEVWVWHAAVTLAWLRATTGDGEGLDEVLAVGVAAWKKAGQPPFEGGALLFEFDHYPRLLGALERQGLQLEREAGRAHLPRRPDGGQALESLPASTGKSRARGGQRPPAGIRSTRPHSLTRVDWFECATLRRDPSWDNT